MGKVVDTAGLKIANTGPPTLPGPDALGPPPAPLASPEASSEKARTITPARTAAIVAFVAAVIGGFGLLYAQSSQSGSRVEAHMARVDRLDDRFDALTSKLDAVGARLDAMGARLQSMSNRVEGLGTQVSTGLRDANRSLSETLNTNLNALSQRLTAQQQQQQKEQREREQRQQQSSPPSSSSTAPGFSPYSTAPGSTRPRRSFP